METTQLTTLQEHDLELQSLLEQAQEFASSAHADNTLRAYRSHWNQFSEWCMAHGLDALPSSPGTVCMFLVSMSKSVKVSSLDVKVAAINKAHITARFDSPTQSADVQLTMKGLRNKLGVPSAGKSALSTDAIKRLLEFVPTDTLAGLRNKSLILLGFATGCRRSELVALNVSDLSFVDKGLLVTLNRSKTDQIGHGRTIAVTFGKDTCTCPVRATRAYLSAGGITHDAVFRRITKSGNLLNRLSAEFVADTIKYYCNLAGYDASLFAGHSLRRGMITQARENNATDRVIMQSSGHKSVAMLDTYTQTVDKFKDSASDYLGL